jgi:hypothetical protein
MLSSTSSSSLVKLPVHCKLLVGSAGVSPFVSQALIKPYSTIALWFCVLALLLRLLWAP